MIPIWFDADTQMVSRNFKLHIRTQTHARWHKYSHFFILDIFPNQKGEGGHLKMFCKDILHETTTELLG